MVHCGRPPLVPRHCGSRSSAYSTRSASPARSGPLASWRQSAVKLRTVPVARSSLPPLPEPSSMTGSEPQPTERTNGSSHLSRMRHGCSKLLANNDPAGLRAGDGYSFSRPEKTTTEGTEGTEGPDPLPPLCPLCPLWWSFSGLLRQIQVPPHPTPDRRVQHQASRRDVSRGADAHAREAGQRVGAPAGGAGGEVVL